MEARQGEQSNGLETSQRRISVTRPELTATALFRASHGRSARSGTALRGSGEAKHGLVTGAELLPDQPIAYAQSSTDIGESQGRTAGAGWLSFVFALLGQNAVPIGYEGSLSPHGWCASQGQRVLMLS